MTKLTPADHVKPNVMNIEKDLFPQHYSEDFAQQPISYRKCLHKTLCPAMGLRMRKKTI